jgi:delta8-fatty-acid desaturase
MEKLTLIAFACWYIGLVSTLPASHIFPYVLISHRASGMLHLQICLSHFAMETFNGTPYTPGNKRDEWF